MQPADTLESTMYHQRRAYKAWLNEATRRLAPPSDESAELVWELLVMYGESVDDIRRTGEDIYKTAYELATRQLAEMRIERVMEIYRDCLVEAMLDVSANATSQECRSLVRFANVVSTAFCEAQSDLLRKTIRHARTERLSDEMKLAKQIQGHLLPKVIPSIPGYDFSGRLIPAQEVGGDYWSVKHYEDDGIVTMKLADISGHGMAAATLVAAVKFISGGYYRGSESAAEVMRQTNRVLTKETPYDVLVTMVYAWLRPDTRKMTVVNAGHEPVFLCREDVCTDVPPTGPVLGVTESADYKEKSYALTTDDIVFFGSDGITDAGIGEPFGVERLKNVVTENAHLSADQIADSVVAAVTRYARRPHDDISMLVLKVTGDSDESS